MQSPFISMMQSITMHMAEIKKKNEMENDTYDFMYATIIDNNQCAL